MNSCVVVTLLDKSLMFGYIATSESQIIFSPDMPSCE